MLSAIDNTHYTRVLVNYDTLAERKFLPRFFVGILIKDKKRDYSYHLSLNDKWHWLQHCGMVLLLFSFGHLNSLSLDLGYL